MLVYLLHTAEFGITYDGMLPGRQGMSAQSEGPGAAGEREIMQALSDANWEVARSISGYYLSLAGAAFAIMEQAGSLPYGASRYAGVKRGQPSCDHGGVRLRWTSA